MKRSYLYSTVIAAFFAGTIAMSGCKAPTVAYQVQQFASLRVMNFSPNCTAPMDVYWDVKPPTPKGNNAQIYNLPYGSSSVYTNSLSVGTGGTTYFVTVTQTRNPQKQDFPAPIQVTMKPGGAYTLMITLDPNNPSVFQDTIIADEVPPSSIPATLKGPTFVRFMNLRPNVGPLTVHVDDPISGDIVSAQGGEGFFQISPYFALGTALDTSFAFLVTNPRNQVLARLSFQTFVAGGYYTLVYAGDPCNTVASNPADTSISALDTFRLHAFDDNTAGNDVTNPIVYSFRYNIINDIYPVLPYDPNNSSNNVIGFLVNGEGFPEHSGYSINPIPALYPGGAGVAAIAQSSPNDSVYDVNYQSSVLGSPVEDIKGFSTNASGSVQRQVFDYSLSSPSASIPQDKPVTFLFGGSDTVQKATGYWAAGLIANTKVFQVPDVNYSDSVTFVLINGVNTTKGATSNAYFWFQSPDGTVTQPPGNGYAFSRTSPVVFRFPLSTSSPFTVTDSIGSGATRVPGSTMSFTADPGGIYEVVPTGIRTDSHLLIIHVNANATNP